MLLQLYLHFPFCKRKCLYCDFCSLPAAEEQVRAYCAALEKEICRMGERYPQACISTVFLGGGTPSIVPADAMAGVMDALRGAFAFGPEVEFTSEANPGTLTDSWLDTLLGAGMNRLSLGVQAAQDELLGRIGRIHTFQQARQAVDMARRAGIRNLNLDVMSGLPGQTLSMYLDSLQAMIGLSPEHISAYSLILEEGTPLYAAVTAGRETLPDEETTALMYEQGAAWLEKAGYARYEISNFAYPGYQCRHNLGYWQGAWYLGLGAAAHSMLPPEQEGSACLRRANISDVEEYITRMQQGLSPVESEEPISPAEARFETMMLGLRTTAGVGEQDFLRRHGKPLADCYGPRLDRLAQEGLGQWKTDGQQRRFSLTNRGLEVQNEVLIRLMD